MCELKKKWKGTDEYICWDRALVLWKRNLPGRGLTKVEKHWHRQSTALHAQIPQFHGKICVLIDVRKNNIS